MKNKISYLSQMCDTGSRDGTSGEEEDLQEIIAGSWQSTTPSNKPMTHDKIYYFLPYWDDKPCLHVRSIWPDYRRRMYNSNIISKIVDKLVSLCVSINGKTSLIQILKISPSKYRNVSFMSIILKRVPSTN